MGLVADTTVMGSAAAGKFQDHYKLLGIDSKATPDVIQMAYNALFAMYDVKKGSEPNEEKLREINLALEVLMDPAARKMFDAVRGGEDEREVVFSGMRFFENLPLERDRRMAMLCLLYDVRCQNPRVPTVTLRQFEKMVRMTEEQIQLCLWYLKTLGHISVDDKSKMQITAAGMDYLEENLPDPKRIWPVLRTEEKAAEETAGLGSLSSTLRSLKEPARGQVVPDAVPEPAVKENAIQSKPSAITMWKQIPVTVRDK
ncbi:MAG: J domain-containing protein [Acidobacteriota bacterium]